jgi:hypothetical protein
MRSLFPTRLAKDAHNARPSTGLQLTWARHGASLGPLPAPPERRPRRASARRCCENGPHEFRHPREECVFSLLALEQGLSACYAYPRPPRSILALSFRVRSSLDAGSV